MPKASAIYKRFEPEGMPSPLVFDSPHSGSIYPENFDFACPAHSLRQAEDSFVDDLFAAAPYYGATFLAALFPRSYIDVNRAVDDIDPHLLAAPWPAARPSEKSRVGMGLVRRICKPGIPVYSRKLKPAEIQARIESYYFPYHRELDHAIQTTFKKFGAVWHINCHSMPSSSVGGPVSGHGGHGWERADFVLGDRDGTTCDHAFRKVVAKILERMGYSVRINDPYKGVEIVRRYGNPAQGVHSLQLEINRRLYLNEETLTPSPGYERLKNNINALMAALQAYTNDQLYSAAAD